MKRAGFHRRPAAKRAVAVVALTLSGLAAAAVIGGSVGGGGAAQAAPNSGPTTAAPACGSAALSNPSPKSKTPPTAGEAFDIKAWLAEKAKAAAGSAGSAAAKVAFDYIGDITGLHTNPDAEILRQLHAINDQLALVNTRLDAISTKLDLAIKEARRNELITTLRAVCDKVNNSKAIYLDDYIPVVKAGATLGDILNSNHREWADMQIDTLPPVIQELYGSPPPCNQNLDTSKQLACRTPRQLVADLQTLFLAAFNPPVEMLRLDTAISNFLRPSVLGNVLTDFGKDVMTKRIIGRSDSEAMRALYDELAQAEALAAWMIAEYHVLDNRQTTRDAIFARYAQNTADEEAGLPPMIPAGAIIDLGDTVATTTKNHPIWMLATPQDQDHWVINEETNNAVGTGADGAGQAIAALNSKSCVQPTPPASPPPCFTHWRIPTRANMTALMSDGCPKKCTPLIKPGAGNDNVASYLAKLNPDDPVWTGVFCDRTGATGSPNTPTTCAPAPQHGFIWTDDHQQYKMACGFYVLPVFGSFDYERHYSLRFGIQTQSNDLSQAAQLYPQLPKDRRVPGYTNDGVDNGPHSWPRCDNYTRAQLPLPENKGIVLATDNTGTAEFMAQP
jgi:hypothetical protein